MANRYWNPSGNANWGDANVWAETATGDPTGIATPTLNDDVFFTSSNSYKCTVGATANCKSLDFTGGTGFTGEFAGSSAINVYGSLTLNSGMTLSTTGVFEFKATSGTNTIRSNTKEFPNRIYFNGSGGTFQLLDGMTISGSKNLELGAGTFDANSQTVSLIGPQQQIIGNFTFYNLTFTGTTVKTNYRTVTGNITVSNNLTINGNSSINRLLIQSDTKGTQRTITCNGTVTVTNADFQDIKGAGSGSWDLSAITGGSGNCGGNSDITFTTPTTTTCSAGTTWSTATWSSRVPLPQDTANFSGSSRTITQDMPRIGSVDFTGSSGLTWTTSTACSVFGSINLTDLGTLTNSTQTYIFEGRGSNTLTSAGKTWGIRQFQIRCPSGTLSLGDDLEMGASGDLSQLYVLAGTFNANNHNIKIGQFVSSNDVTRTINMGSGTWEIRASAGGDCWNCSTTTNIDFNCDTSNIKFSGPLTSAKNFQGGGLTYNNVWNATTGDYAIVIAGSNTFNDFKINAGRKQNFATGTTQTVNTFTALGEVGNLITIRSSTTTNATLTKAGGGTIDCDYIDIDYITGSPDDTWYMGNNSTDGGHNSQIYFTEPPATTNTTNFFMFF